jgi:hypothetical protein
VKFCAHRQHCHINRHQFGTVSANVVVARRGSRSYL